jgi:hypothetical protein
MTATFNDIRQVIANLKYACSSADQDGWFDDRWVDPDWVSALPSGPVAGEGENLTFVEQLEACGISTALDLWNLLRLAAWFGAADADERVDDFIADGRVDDATIWGAAAYGLLPS